MGKTWQNSNDIKNYFPLPNEIYRLGLSPAEVSIYGYLLSVEDRRTYQCYPSYTTIGEAVGMSKKTVAKYVAMLVDKGLITVEPTTILARNGKRMNGSLLYTIRPIREAVELRHERQLRELEETVARSNAKALAEKRGVQFSATGSEVCQ